MFKKLKEKIYPLKQWLVSIFYYPKMEIHDPKYNRYWHQRRLTSKTGLNSFQKKRANLTLSKIEEGSVLMDIGCGNGGVLAYINERKPMRDLVGIDISEYALKMAQEKDIKTFQKNIFNLDEMKDLPPADYIFLFEVLEHMINSEALLKWATKTSQKGVFFSVPNTGFFVHRLRLLFGRFPLQWRVHPSEHLRFWTVKDMKLWLKELGYKNYILKIYEGAPVLNKIWPSLFGQGIWVYISTDVILTPL